MVTYKVELANKIEGGRAGEEDAEMVTISERRNYQLGGGSSFEVSTIDEFFAAVCDDRRSQRAGGDCQGLGYSVATEADAEAIGAEDTVGGWYHRDLDQLIGVREVQS